MSMVAGRCDNCGRNVAYLNKWIVGMWICDDCHKRWICGMCNDCKKGNCEVIAGESMEINSLKECPVGKWKTHEF